MTDEDDTALDLDLIRIFVKAQSEVFEKHGVNNANVSFFLRVLMAIVKGHEKQFSLSQISKAEFLISHEQICRFL